MAGTAPSQGMMLSERPGGARSGYGGGGGVSAQASVGIGNYKGVMLCNRPFGGVAAAARMQHTPGSDGTKGPFKCGCVADEFAFNSTRDAKTVRRAKQANALTRHKRWLAELQQTKDRLEKKYLEDQAARAHRKDRFAAHEAKMRAAIRTTIHPGNSSKVDPGLPTTGEDNDSQAHPETNETPRASAVNKRMPRWALTEGQAQQAQEKDEDDEIGDLVDFANGLNYEKYMDDLEVRTMIEQVAKRIHELEASAARDEGDDKMEADRMKEKLQSIAQRGTNQEEESEGEKDDARSNMSEDDLLALAREVLARSNDDELNRVHSARSVAAVVSRTMDKPSSAPLSTIKEGHREVHAMAHPKVVEIKEDGGSRLTIKKAPSQLPYLNRNPAI